jgi:outer membrane usher protein
LPSTHDLKWLRAGLLCAALWSGEAIAAADRVLVLEVVINGRATGQVSEFIERDGSLYVRPADLVAVGLILPPQIASGSEPVALSSLPDLSARVDEAKQTLLIAAADAALQPTEIRSGPPTRLTPLTRAEFGALLNYDAAITYSDKRATGGALVDLRLFGPYGVVESTALVSLSPSQKRITRLDTTYVFTQASRLRRWRFGDVVSGALPWTRAVRIGGAQVASDFALRPDLVTYPLPEISSSAAVPSTVSVMVNGIRQLSQSVEPGPFAIRSLPVVSGAGEVAVTLLDALGQQTVIRLPFYASTALLKPGLASYSLEVGAVREDYGLASDRYSGWAASQSSRLGVTEWLTVESHAEAAPHFAMLGGGAALLAGQLGIVSLAIAGSTAGGERDSPASGILAAAGFQRVSPSVTMSVSGTYASRGYRDLAAEHGSPVPKSTVNANLGYQLGKWGAVGLAYNRRVSRAEPPAPPASLDPESSGDQTIELVTGSYSASIPGFSNVYASGFMDLREAGAYGLAVGLSFGLGGSAFATVETAIDDGRSRHSLDVVKSAQRAGEFGYRLRASEGAVRRQSLEGEYLGSWGRVTGGVDHFGSRLAARAGARGAVVLAGGALFASNPIDDSFAVVSTGEVGGVPVMYENRLVGRTNSRGKLLIPSLRSFEDNRLSVDTRLLPPDVEVGLTEINVRPGDRSGVPVDFQVRKVAAALVTLHDGSGRPLPLGSVASVDGADGQPVGHDGAAYVTGLKSSNRMQVALPDGSSCSVQFAYQPIAGDIPAIGPLRCR